MESTYLVTCIRERLAREEGELGIGVEVLRRVVFLTGVVPSEERRERVELHARSLCGGYALVNEIAVRAPGAAAAEEPLS